MGVQVIHGRQNTHLNHFSKSPTGKTPGVNRVFT